MAVRKIPCICQTAKVTKNVVKKPAKTLEGFFAKMPVSIKNILGDAQAALQSAAPATAKSLIEKDGGKCELCGGNGTVEDSTDTRDVDKQAAKLAQSKSKEIQELEAKMGLPGGNRHQIIVGNDLLEVGLGMNDTPSYLIKEGKGFAQTSKIASQGTTPNPIKTNQVVGTNPLATPGGQYVIKCSNKFTVYSGAQGIEFNSHGPIVFKGGITKFVGPELTLGSAKGQVTIEGDHLQLTGKSINISPDSAGKGQVNVQGTLSTNGNLVTQGGAHIEGDLSFISATCPMKIDRTRFASTADQTTGHAEWQTKAASQGAQDFVRKIQTKVTDPALLQMSPREINNLILETKQLIQKALIIEPVTTGWIIPGTRMLLQATCPCNYGGSAGGVITATVISPIDLRNFPHHHILSDGTHTHDMQVPNIRLMNNDEEVRKTASNKDKVSPVGTHKDTNIFSGFGPITSVLKMLAVKLVK